MGLMNEHEILKIMKHIQVNAHRAIKKGLVFRVLIIQSLLSSLGWPGHSKQQHYCQENFVQQTRIWRYTFLMLNTHLK